MGQLAFLRVHPQGAGHVSREPSHRRRVSRCPLIADVESAFYLHFDVADRPGVLAAITQALGEHGVSIKSVVQRGMGERARLVMVTHPVLESSLRAAIERVGAFEFSRSAPRTIRVIEEEFV